MIDSDSEPSSWDFPQVHDLLRSPTEGGTSNPIRHHQASDPSVQEIHVRADGDDKHSGKARPLTSRRSHTKLGDFGSLWELLNQRPASVSLTSVSATRESKPQEAKPQPDLLSVLSILQRPTDRILSDTSVAAGHTLAPSDSSRIKDLQSSQATVTGHALLSVTSTQPLSILKKVTDDPCSGNPVNVKFDNPRTPTRHITGIGSSNDTPKVKLKHRVREKAHRTDNLRQTISSSEDSAGVESDSSLVFDHSTPQRPRAFAFVPSQVGWSEATNDRYDTPPSSYDDQQWALDADTIRNDVRVRSTLYKSSTERRITLMIRLRNDFPDCAKILPHMGQSLLQNPNERIESRPIHIFVDMSNIMVGFHDSVKSSRNIPQSTRIRRVPMSFSNLALIMERGRQAAKRVLAGSDHLPSIDEAEKLGYETNILERVQKTKYASTPRRNNKRRKSLVCGSQGSPGGPETATASGERWVEQGVDEILHLKIMETLLDFKRPATIVLATGDAAVAEFSEGFMRMVERALQHGWIVELVSFAQGTSYAYRKKEFRKQWGDQFRLVQLDPYIEELFE